MAFGRKLPLVEAICDSRVNESQMLTFCFCESDEIDMYAEGHGFPLHFFSITPIGGGGRHHWLVSEIHTFPGCPYIGFT